MLMICTAAILRRCGIALLFVAFAVCPDVVAASHNGGSVRMPGAGTGRTVKVRVTGASGLFSKSLSLRGRRVGEVQEREFASVRYGGLGQFVSSIDWIIIRDVSAVYLQLDIDPQFALPGRPLHMRSDDAATSHYLFHRVDQQWKQLPRGISVDIFSYAGCGLREFAWEDGGDFLHQDFFFEVDAGPNCFLLSRATKADAVIPAVSP